ncbi:N-acetylglucosamine kinase [Martelella alba]|nr:BadF/BadG/BcrA/BcrD ATPase family protein [Martelella alba]
MSAFYLGADVGGTASRFCLTDQAGAVIRRGTAPGATGHMFNPDARAAFERTVDAIAACVPEPLSGLVIGMTGYGPRAETDIAEIIEKRLKVAPAKIFARDDIELAFRAVFAPGKGHLVSAGTGSIAVHLTEAETLLRIGGRGTMIDDGGSGAWIALAALRALYRRIDEDGSPGDMTILADRLFAAMGGSDWSDTRSYVYGGDRGRIGALAKAVAEAAEEGDGFADQLLRQAGFELARLGNILIARGGTHPVAFIGGVLTLSPVIGATILAELKGEAMFPVLDQAEGAARLARNHFSAGEAGQHFSQDKA